MWSGIWRLIINRQGAGINRLWPFRGLLDGEFHQIAIIQAVYPFCQAAVVDKDFFAICLGDEAPPFEAVVPFHSTAATIGWGHQPLAGRADGWGLQWCALFGQFALLGDGPDEFDAAFLAGQ